MVFNVGVIGCSGSRFKDIYLPFFIEKQKQNEIKIVKVYNRTKEAAIKTSIILESLVAESIENILNDEDINVIFFDCS